MYRTVRNSTAAVNFW